MGLLGHPQKRAAPRRLRWFLHRAEGRTDSSLGQPDPAQGQPGHRGSCGPARRTLQGTDSNESSMADIVTSQRGLFPEPPISFLFIDWKYFPSSCIFLGTENIRRQDTGRRLRHPLAQLSLSELPGKAACPQAEGGSSGHTHTHVHVTVLGRRHHWV